MVRINLARALLRREYQRDHKRRQYEADPERFRARAKAWRERNREAANARRSARYYAQDPATRSEKRWLKKYGITKAQRDALLVAQGSRCPVCDETEPSGANGWAVDHCHDTGRIRGVLCRRCNLILGQLGDSEADVERMAAGLLAYLRSAS